MSWLSNVVEDIAKVGDKIFGSHVVDAVQTVNSVVGSIVGYYYGGYLGSLSSQLVENSWKYSINRSRGVSASDALHSAVRSQTESAAALAVMYGIGAATGTEGGLVTGAGDSPGAAVAPAATSATDTTAPAADASAAPTAAPAAADATTAAPTPADVPTAPAGSSPDAVSAATNGLYDTSGGAGLTPATTPGAENVGTSPDAVDYSGMSDGSDQNPDQPGLLRRALGTAGDKLGAGWNSLGSYGKGQVIGGALQLGGQMLAARNTPTPGETEQQILAARQRANRLNVGATGAVDPRFAPYMPPGTAVPSSQNFLAASGYANPFDARNPMVGVVPIQGLLRQAGVGSTGGT